MTQEKEITVNGETYNPKYILSNKSHFVMQVCDLGKYASLLAGIYDISDGSIGMLAIGSAALYSFSSMIKNLARSANMAKGMSILEKKIMELQNKNIGGKEG